MVPPKQKELKPSIPLNLNFREFQHEIVEAKLIIKDTIDRYSEFQVKNTFYYSLI